jgi:large repetitive protein
VANAGSDQTVEEEALVTLDGSGTIDPNGSDDIQSYTWQQLEGKEVTLSNALLVAPSFTAPEVEVTEDPMFLVFKLIVVDFAGLTSEDTVTIKVRRGPIGGSSAGCFISEAVQ